MTEAEEQELFARLERLERSNWRWKLLASVLAVFFLLLLSLGVVSAVAIRTRQVAQFHLAVEEEHRARMAAEEARLEAERAQAATLKAAGEAAPKRMPHAAEPGKAP